MRRRQEASWRCAAAEREDEESAAVCTEDEEGRSTHTHLLLRGMHRQINSRCRDAKQSYRERPNATLVDAVSAGELYI